MKTRILTAIVGIIVLLGVLFCPYTIVFAVVASILAMIAVWEMLYNTGIMLCKSLLFTSMAFAGAEVFFCAYAERVMDMQPLQGWALPVVFVIYLFVVIWLTMLRKSTIAIDKAAKAVLLTLYATAGFLALARLRLMTDGLAYVMLPLVISWMSDTGAYFTGYFFGKHKMAPLISPKKTWEGFFGGWLVSVGSAALFGVVYQAIAGIELMASPGWMAVAAILLAPLSVCGDLLASLIKRRCGIKDYGTIMPGHGGVMDRFDSVVLIAPLLYTMLLLFV